MTAFTLGTTLLGMLKLHFREGRPFFLTDEIVPASCKDLEYGFPSGHATVATSTFATLLFCAINKRSFGNSLSNNVWVCCMAWLILCVAILVVCFSRLFLGVHSIDQLLVGLIVGSLITLSMILLHKDNSMKTARFDTLKSWSGLVKVFFTNLSAFTFLICQLYALYIFKTGDHDLKPQWKTNIDKVCGQTAGGPSGGVLLSLS